MRWDQNELAVVFEYLENKPQATWTADDWSLLVDWWHQRWLPADMLPASAEWKRLHASLLGRIQASLASRALLTPEQVAARAEELTKELNSNAPIKSSGDPEFDARIDAILRGKNSPPKG